MAEDIHFPAPLDSLFDQISQEFDQTEAANVIHELKRLYPTKKDSFDPTDFYGALKQLYVLGAISDEGKQKFLELLVKKTSKKDDILKLISGHKEASSPRKDGFVGRDNDVEKILKLVTNPCVPGVNLYGDSGVGKTTLAKEVSKKLELEKKDLFLIDLRGTKDTNTVYFKVLEMFKLAPWDYSKERIYSHLQNLATKTILILDNVEQFLSNEKEVDQKRRTEFLEFLRTILSSEASNRGNLKVILTSRIQTGDSMLKDMHFTEYELLPLTEKQSRQLMSRRQMRDESDDKQEKALNEIADLCRNTPYLLERAEQLMRQNFSKPTEVLQKLNTSKNKGVPERFACINALFGSLPSDQLREVAVKISLLQGPFSASTAIRIADLSSDYDAELDLEMLAMHKIVAAEDVNGKRKYDFYELFREFVASYLCVEDPDYKEAYEEGESQFVKHFSMIFTQHAKNLDKDFVGTYKELEEDKANLELLIDLVTRKEIFDIILQSHDVTKTAMLLEAFKSIEHRRRLFGQWAEIAERKGCLLSSVNFRCWESIQLADLEGTRSACEALKRAEMSLAKAMLLLMPEQIKAAKGLYNYCSGRIKCMTSANLIDESSKKEKERLLKQALYDLKLSLAIHRKIYGDHTLTARTLNLIGNCHMERGEPKEALEFYQRAIDVKIRVVGSEKHFDIPSYYNNISQAYEALGNAGTPTGTSWSLQSFANLIRSFFSQEKRQRYQKAADYLDKALNLQKELGVNDTNDTATFTRNLANILIVLGEYEKALKHAKKSFEIRKANLGDHPETVRILYLIGIIHEWRKDLEAALQSYEEAFAMEESLPEDNHSVVRKLLCDRLEEMCKKEKIKKSEKIEKYRPRMEEIRKLDEKDKIQKIAYLGKLSSDKLYQSCVMIQKNFRCWRKKHRYARMKKAAILIQAWVRGDKARRRALNLRCKKAALTIQRYLFSYRCRNAYVYVRSCAITIQAYTRGMIARRLRQQLLYNSKACIIQCCWRGYKGRQKYRNYFKKITQLLLVRAKRTQKAQEGFIRPTNLDEIPLHDWPNQTDNVYKMTSYQRGVAVIVNIEHFNVGPDHDMYGKLDDRVGSKRDKENVAFLFQHLGFIVETIKKTSGNDLLAELHRISSDYDFSEFDCFVLFVMSHGTKDSIYTSDGKKITRSSIVILFRNSKCTSLAGKPKLFFFQACRGEKEDRGVCRSDAPEDLMKAATNSIPATSEPNDADDLGVPLSDGPEDVMEAVTIPTASEPNNADRVPETADILEFNSSYVGYKSFRNSETGSPFVQSVVEVFRKYACHHHILELITKVKKRVSEDDKHLNEKKQMPHSNDTLRKKLYFWPGVKF